MQYTTTFRLPPGVVLPANARGGSHTANITANAALQGDTIRGTLQGSSGQPVSFEATRSVAEP
jgi:hypothetical protein